MTLARNVQFLYTTQQQPRRPSGRLLAVLFPLLSLSLLPLLPGCGDVPASEDIAAGDADGVDGTDAEVFNPAIAAPYSCDYVASGSFAKLASDECNVIAPDCINSGDTCVLTDVGARCLPPGSDECGDSCELVNDCAQGLMCVGNSLACRAACRPGDPCPGKTVCRAVSGRPDVGFCPVPCSVLEPDCPSGDGCYLLFGSMECAPTRPDPKGVGDPCTTADACEAGLICQDASNLRCLQPCTAYGAYPCAETFACETLSGLEPLGVCLPQ